MGSQRAKASSGGQQSLLSTCVDMQADLSLGRVHMQSCRRKCCALIELIIQMSSHYVGKTAITLAGLQLFHLLYFISGETGRLVDICGR